MSLLLLVILLSILAVLSYSSEEIWTRGKNINFPTEMRIVNEGVSHDDKYLYFSNQHLLYRTTINPIEVLETKEGIPLELLKEEYNHIGDFDVDSNNGIMYIGIEKSGHQPNGIIAALNTSDFSMIRYKVTTQQGMPWVAVDYNNKLVYSAVWNADQLQVYDLDTFDFVKQVDLIPFDQAIGTPKEIQGAAFYQSYLYITSNTNCSVWKVDVNTGVTTFVLSDEYNRDKLQMEMEGITFFENEELQSNGYGLMMIYGNFMSFRKSLHTFIPVSTSP